MQIERLKLEHKLSKGGWYGLLKTHWTREETDWSMLEMKKKIEKAGYKSKSWLQKF